ncbi:hypothetical protein PlfCFBP13513_15125 [Plantibacter flavus]|uniref:DUF7507 domain-containing protein n=1 Tax=Plantibacter TaxID=190323 RepID=UPI0010C24176|nr:MULTISPECIES: hypothetical protein [Plantibacter]MBD8103832.1 hypothetical protein [Plantibacter sp. CFBP 8775]MBD8467279.1 hypothetical protein [Plantibacter sp. CFBP 8798]TKJ96752.1 hypothetical protein PlfCFBP13513_15125 [Plantibacter flavus]
MAAFLVLTGAGAAFAASGEYTVELTAPDSVPIYDQFTYTATVSTEATAGEPTTGLVLTSVLAEGLTFDSVPTGADSPVASVTYDEATRTVTFVMKDLAEQLTSFTYSVKQVNNSVKDASTVYNTSITGSATPSGATPGDKQSTAVTGDNNYRPLKRNTTLEGSGNRLVTYSFDVQTVNGTGSTTTTFTSWSQTLTDTIPAGAQIVGKSTGFGEWTTAANGDGSTTAVWKRDGTYGPSTLSLDSIGNRIWIQVEYPQENFPGGTRPPVNNVDLTVTDHSGGSFGPSSAQTQGPELVDGRTKGIFLTKDADDRGNNAAQTASGAWQSQYLVKASYLNQLDSDQLGDLIIEDSAAQSPENAEFFDHADVYRFLAQFNPTLKSAALPYTLEYTTSASAAWKSYDTAGKTTAEDVRLVVQTEGSTNFPEGGYVAGIDVPVGEHLTGWRIHVSPEAATSIPSGSEVRVAPSYIASYAAFSDGSAADGALTNTATATGATVAGTVYSADDDALIGVQDRVNIVTMITSPSTLNVGSSAVFTANISNLDPAGRDYKNSVMEVVLPVGVVYDASIGASPTTPTTRTSGLTVPTVGNGVTVTTKTVTDTAGEHQVVVFTFDDLPSLRKNGDVKERWEDQGFRYNIPTNVLPQAFSATNTTTIATTWAYTNDPAHASTRMDFYGPYYSADTYNFSATLDRIARSSVTPVVTTAGGLLLGKQVRADASQLWNLDAVAASPGAADWQVYVSNVLPQTVTDIVVFDRLPFVGDSRGSEFAVTLSGPVTGLPAGASVEYSTNATSATSGTWTTVAAGARAFRVMIPSLANAQNVSLVAPTTIPEGLSYNQEAVNNITATGSYQGSSRNFSSNDAVVRAAAKPSLELVKQTNGVRYTEAPGALVATGSAVTWTYQVTNTGDAPLADVSISDAFTDEAGSGTIVPTSTESGPLQPGQTRTFTATGTAVAGQYHNVATATGRAVDSAGVQLPQQPAPVTDESWYLAGDSGLTITKTTNGEDVTSAPGLPLKPGSAVEWAYTVTNTGTLPLKDVTVVDLDADGEEVFNDVIDVLAPGASVVLTATGTAIEGQYHNTVTATAADPAGGETELRAADDSWYFGVVSGLEVQKQVSANQTGPWSETTEVKLGAASYWRIVVTNAGNAPLTDVTVTDAQLQQTIKVGALLPGESHTVVLPLEKTQTGLTNVAVATGTDLLGETLTAKDDASVTVVDPAGLAHTGTTAAIGAGLALLLLAAGGIVLILRRVRRNAS